LVIKFNFLTIYGVFLGITKIHNRRTYLKKTSKKISCFGNPRCATSGSYSHLGAADDLRHLQLGLRQKNPKTPPNDATQSDRHITSFLSAAGGRNDRTTVLHSSHHCISACGEKPKEQQQQQQQQQ
jgi:hypothetical protein